MTAWELIKILMEMPAQGEVRYCEEFVNIDFKEASREERPITGAVLTDGNQVVLYSKEIGQV